MQRVRFLVDGFNLYHSLKDAGEERDSELGTTGCLGTRWLDISKLCKSLSSGHLRKHKVEKIQYFSAYATHLQERKPQVIQRHERYIEALKSSGVEVVLGKFKKAGPPNYSRYEEKGTDVAIAAHMLVAFALDTCDTVVLVTGDTDLVPAIELAKTTFPNKRIGVLIPHNRHNEELKRAANWTVNIKRKNYFKNQFPDPVLSGKVSISKPATW